MRKRWLLRTGWGLLIAPRVGFRVLGTSSRDDYAARAKIEQGHRVAKGVTTAIGKRWRQTQTFPHSNEEAGIAPPEAFGGPYVESLAVTDNASIVVRYVNSAKLPNGVRGRAIVFVPKPEADGLNWDCTKGDMPGNFRPRNCRGVE